MIELVFRTEDLRPEEVLELFAESVRDRETVNSLKSRNPIVLVGSRGVGKSFLMRVAESELHRDFEAERVVPVYMSFTRSSLVRPQTPAQFQHWMLAKICSRTIRSLRSLGMLDVDNASARVLSGDNLGGGGVAETRVERLEKEFEESWQFPNREIDVSSLPSIDHLKDAIEDMCVRVGLRRFVVLFDEAAHVFMPEQQRAFFTLFRDFRSAYISCKAAIYPGVTTFGDTFQIAHDASKLVLDRDVLDLSYVDQMREIVSKQADAGLKADILRNADSFSVLAYAATGNPRLLLKTLSRAGRLNVEAVNGVLKSFYRTELWSEHTALGDRYQGHRPLIDWGRNFIEDEVLPGIRKRIGARREHDGRSSAFFWVHKDATESVKESLRLLAYTGIVIEHSEGIKATRSQLGTRYLLNLGIVFSGLEPSPAALGLDVARTLDPRLMTEFGANYAAFASNQVDLGTIERSGIESALQDQLEKPVDVLDISEWQKTQLISLGIVTVGDVLRSTERQIRQAYYVGEKRSRRIRNAAVAAVLEYLSG